MHNDTQAPTSYKHLASGRSAGGSTGYLVSGGLTRCKLRKIITGTSVASATITVYDGPANATTPVVVAVITENGAIPEWDMDDVQILNGIYVVTSSTNDDLTITYIG